MSGEEAHQDLEKYRKCRDQVDGKILHEVTEAYHSQRPPLAGRGAAAAGPAQNLAARRQCADHIRACKIFDGATLSPMHVHRSRAALELRLGLLLALLLFLPSASAQKWDMTGWSPANAANSGGTRVTVIGQQFGYEASAVEFRIGGTACIQTKWTSDTTISATVPGSGVRFSDIVVITFQTNQKHTRNWAFTFDAPIIMAASPGNSPADPDGTVTFMGKNFGVYDTSPRGRLGGTACESSKWASWSSIVCKLPSGASAGAGQSAGVVLSVSQPDGRMTKYTATRMFTYDRPVILVLKDGTGTKSNGPATGGNTVTAIGVNFGVFDRSAAPFIGGTKSLGSIWTSDTSLGIVVASGVQTEHAVAISMDGKYGGGFLQAYDFDSPAISQVHLGNGPVTGNIVLTLFGKNYGTVDRSPLVRIDGKLCKVTRWVSDSVIECNSPSNTGSSHDVGLSILDKTSMLTLAYSYDKPVVTNIALGNGPAIGTKVATIAGKNFGTSGSYLARGSIISPKGGGACLNSEWMSDSMLRCALPAGLGSDAAVIVDFAGGEAGQMGTLTKAFTYDAPVILYPGSWPYPGKISNSPSNSPAEVPITGRNFGSNDYSVKSAVGGSVCISTVWMSDSELRCTMQKGILGSHAITVSVESKLATFTNAITFDSPAITKMLQQNGAAGGASLITLLGRNFGSYQSTQALIIGNSKSTLVRWTSDSSLIASTPYGRGVGLTVAALQSVNTGGGTYERHFTYDDPVITSSHASNGPQSGQFVITLTGASFGGVQPAFEVFVGSSSCSTQKWQSDSSVECTLRGGIGKVDTTLALFPGQPLCTGNNQMCVATKIGGFQYDGPHPLALYGATNGPSSGTGTVTVTGTHFGDVDPGDALIASVGATKCTATTWVSATALKCTLAPGLGSSDVHVDLAGSKRGIGRVFTYNAPSITSWSVFEGPQVGGTEISVTGSNFGAKAGLGPSGISIDGSDCSISRYISSTSVVILSPPGVKRPAGNFVMIGAPGTPAAELQTLASWTYHHPVISATSPAAIPNVRGGSIMTVLGKNFGGLDSSPTVFIGTEYTSCRLTTWSSDSSIMCTTPAVSSGKQAISYLSGAKGTSKAVLVNELAQQSGDDSAKVSTAFAAKAKELTEFLDAPQALLAYVVLDISAENCTTPSITRVGDDTLRITIKLAAGWCRAASGAGSLLVYILPSSLAPFKADEVNSTVIASKAIIGLSFRGLTPEGSLDISAPLDLDMIVAAGGVRRRLLQFGGKKVRQSWLNKCTGKWIPLCETTTDPKSISSSVSAAVASDKCFNPSLESGTCAQSVISAEMCGNGGQILAFGHTDDPCEEVQVSSARGISWPPIIVGIVAGTIALGVCIGCGLKELHRRRKSNDEVSDYSSESESRSRSSLDGDFVFSKSSRAGTPTPFMPASQVFSQNYQPSLYSRPINMSPNPMIAFQMAPYEAASMQQRAPYDSYDSYGAMGPYSGSAGAMGPFAGSATPQMYPSSQAGSAAPMFGGGMGGMVGMGGMNVFDGTGASMNGPYSTYGMHNGMKNMGMQNGMQNMGMQKGMQNIDERML